MLKDIKFRHVGKKSLSKSGLGRRNQQIPWKGYNVFPLLCVFTWDSIQLCLLVCVFYIVGPLSVWEHIRAALPVLPISPPAGDGPCDWWLLHRIREYLGCIYLQTYVHIGYHILLYLFITNATTDVQTKGKQIELVKSGLRTSETY